MRCDQVKGPWHQEDLDREKLQWVHKPPPRNVRLRRKILGKVIEVGVKLLFTTFSYTFGGKIYKQLDRAPIGTRVACAAANLVMEHVWNRMRAIFKNSGPSYKLWMALNFVDDARCWVTALRLGTRYTMGKLEWTLEAQREDEEAKLTPEDVTFREVLKALKSVSQHLDFTTEKPSDFADHWIPTLDFKIGQDHEANRYVHNFYEKPMNSKWVLPHLSAMDPTSKRQILANDLVRRMSRIDPSQLDKLAVPVINRYNHKLIYSGYPHDERMRIVESGISIYHDKLDTAQKEGREFYRMGANSLETRSRKALLEKVSWYKGPAWTRYLKGQSSPEDRS